MAKNVTKEKSLGAWAFIVGVVLALLMGLASSWFGNAQGFVVALLVVIGIVVGLLNVSGKESQGFLLAAAVLVIVSNMGQGALGGLSSLGQVGKILGDILKYLTILFVPTTIIVALKSVFAIAKD